jgi:peptidoglycan-associated lipoprotein
MKKLLLLVSIAAVLSGCASGVKLDDVQVDDRSGGASGQSGVNGLNSRNLGAMEGIKQGPVGVEHIIYFDLDSYTVKPEYQNVLDTHARYL